MSDIPPPATNLPTPPMPVDPRRAVQGPAIGLMAMGGFYILWALFRIAAKLFDFGMFGSSSWLGFMAGWVGIFITVVFSLGFALVLFYAGFQMQQLKNYNLVMVAAVIALLPCSYCCCIGIPIGIWALVVLMKPEVKAAFTGPNLF